jgi:hypothetical protein
MSRLPTPDLSPTARVRRTRGRRLAAASLALTVALGAAACSDDDDASSATAAPATVPGEESASAAFCESAMAWTAATTGVPEDPAELGAFVTEVLAPATDALVADLPEDLEETGASIEAIVTQAGGGDPSGMFSPEGAAVLSAVGAEVHDGCDVQQVAVHAVDYEFHGVPDALEAGPTSFELVNDGVEDHEMVLFKRAAGSTAALEELLELPEDEAMAQLEFTGVAFGSPDTTSYTAVDLEPGTYFMVCFIPVGGGEDGPPHFMQGMQRTLTVA